MWFWQLFQTGFAAALSETLAAAVGLLQGHVQGHSWPPLQVSQLSRCWAVSKASCFALQASPASCFSPSELEVVRGHWKLEVARNRCKPALLLLYNRPVAVHNQRQWTL